MASFDQWEKKKYDVFANKHGSIPPHPRAPASGLVVTLMGTYFISATVGPEWLCKPFLKELETLKFLH